MTGSGNKREPDPIKNDRRSARRRQMFPPGTACAICGDTTPEALVRARRPLIEAHHVSARAIDASLLVPLCCKCHLFVTAGQLDAALDFSHGNRSALERAAGALRSQAVFNRALADAQERHADELLTLLDVLDRRYPTWRRNRKGKP
ncbi:MAG: hypothetical protein ACKVUT_03600 [Gaiella sp.]